MPTTTFVPNPSNELVNWNDPARWSGGVVPNDPALDVVIPAITIVSTGANYVSIINQSGAIAVGSLAITSNVLTVTSTFTVSHDVNIFAGNGNPAAELNLLAGSSLVVGGSLDNKGNLQQAGNISVSGIFLNEGTLVGGGLTVAASSFTNTGQIAASSGNLTLTVPPGGFSNLSGSTLTGGSYGASSSGKLYLNVGSVISTDAATISFLGGGEIYSFDDTSHSFVSITSSVHSIAGPGILSINGANIAWSDLTVDGLVRVIGIPNSSATLNSTHLTVDPGGTVVGVAAVIGGPVSNAGTIVAGLPRADFLELSQGTGQLLLITGPVSGSGILEIAPAINNAGVPAFRPFTLELSAAVSSKVVFDDGHGILKLDDPSHFSGQIAPIGGGDQIILRGISFGSVTGYDYSGGSGSGTLIIHTASGDTPLNFLGHLDKSSFTLAAGPQFLSTDPPSLLITTAVTPFIESNGGGDNATVAIPENSTAVTTVVADGSPYLTYTIIGGPDAAKFQINASTGVVSFVAPPDFEIPSDQDHNNSYIVQVRASDDGLIDTQTITVSITDVNDPLPTVHWIRSVDIGPHPAGWLPAGIGDFNVDGTSDLAWYNSATNGIDIWKLANGQWAGSSDVGSHPAGYQPAGFGDFNHDGTSDVLWFNATTRDAEVWKIANGQWAGSADIGTHPAGYLPSGVGDFNGDGTSDVLWYNASTRDAEVWKIANGQWAGSADIGTHPAGYQPSLTGDFNGDGTSDIAWYNPSTNALDIWKIANGQWAGSVDLGAHPAGWQPLGAGDFNRDGTSDIAWYNPTTNDVDIWLIKDGQWAGSVDAGTHPAGSVAVGVGDFDHNGVSDVMWRNTSDGHIDNWMLAFS